MSQVPIEDERGGGRALVLEGGAMRATYASGVAWALHHAGFRPTAVYGTSAGGAIGAWFTTGQLDTGLTTWEKVGDRRLMSFRRLLLGKAVLNGRLIYRELYPNFWKLDVAKLRASPWPMIVTVTDADTGETLYPDLRQAEDPFVLLHATTSLPILSDGPVAWNGRRALDGGVTDPIPLARAIADGHKRIVLVANRVAGERKAESALGVRLVKRAYPQLAKWTAEHHTLHNDAIRLAERPPPGVEVTLIRPRREIGVSRMTRDIKLLRAAIEEGKRDGAEAAAALGLQAPLPSSFPSSSPSSSPST